MLEGGDDYAGPGKCRSEEETEDALSRVHFSGDKCPYCHDVVTQDDPLGRQFCSRCRATHHIVCLEEAKGVCSSCQKEIEILDMPEPCSVCQGALGVTSSRCKQCEDWYHLGCGEGHECSIHVSEVIESPVSLRVELLRDLLWEERYLRRMLDSSRQMSVLLTVAALISVVLALADGRLILLVVPIIGVLIFPIKWLLFFLSKRKIRQLKRRLQIIEIVERNHSVDSVEADESEERVSENKKVKQ